MTATLTGSGANYPRCRVPFLPPPRRFWKRSPHGWNLVKEFPLDPDQTDRAFYNFDLAIS